jgi:hypothetical protein
MPQIKRVPLPAPNFDLKIRLFFQVPVSRAILSSSAQSRRLFMVI